MHKKASILLALFIGVLFYRDVSAANWTHCYSAAQLISYHVRYIAGTSPLKSEVIAEFMCSSGPAHEEFIHTTGFGPPSLKVAFYIDGSPTSDYLFRMISENGLFKQGNCFENVCTDGTVDGYEQLVGLMRW